MNEKSHTKLLSFQKTNKKKGKKLNEEARKYLKHIQATPDQYCDWK